MPRADEVDRKKAALRRSLLAWFRRHARELPWRRSKDPYRVWLSEIMLQQTRVETVIPYYERFTAAFATVQDLAAATDDQVLKLWEGLGYYSRARNLRATAKIVVEGYGGRFPEDAEALQQLPGLGRYSAGAVASIAFGQPVPVLDGNVRRVLTRVFAIRRQADDPQLTKELWSLAERLVAPRVPGDFNQALMELGACRCTPATPDCVHCPLRRSCDAHKQGIQTKLPLRRKKKGIPHYEVVAAALERDGRYLFGKRPTTAMLGGLWELPGGKVKPEEPHSRALRRELVEKLGVEIDVGDLAATVVHRYTHFYITLYVYRGTLQSATPEAREHDELKWISPEEIGQHAFPTSTRKALARIVEACAEDGAAEPDRG
jgi:A/G-specific adenine glycosylase